MKSLLRCEEGIAYVEFIISSTILLMLFFGCVELTRFMLIVQKLEKAVTAVADVVAETDPKAGGITDTQLAQLLGTISNMMNPYSTGTSDPNIRVIVSDILYNTTTSSPNTPVPTINWQYCGGGGGTQGTRLASQTGYTVTKGSTACLGTVPCGGAAGAGLPTSFTNNLNTGEEFVITEISYNFYPISNQSFYQPISANTAIYRTAIYMPRLGALTTFTPATGSSKTTTCP